MSDSVLKRVAIRKYLSDPVNHEDLQKLLSAFQAAPCGMHQTDDMRMTVVADNVLLDRIEAVTKNACYGAPLLFIINVKHSSPFGERDASVAAENIMIEAAELNLGSVYLMNAANLLNNDKNLLKDLGVIDDYEVSVIVACGHAAESPHDNRANRYQVIIK